MNPPLLPRPTGADGPGARRAVPRKTVSRKECDRGLNEMAGYLLWQAEESEAATRAEAFAKRLPWLTGAQREEVVRVYTEDRLETSRAVIQRIADRARELQREYSERYQRLRIRILGLFLAGATGFGAVVLAMTRPR